MKYNKGFAPLILVAIIVGALVIGGGAYYLGKSGSKPVVINPENILPNNENQKLPVVENSQTVNSTSPQVATSCTPTSTPSITVLSPNGGEVFNSGDKITVKWESCNIPVGVDVGIDLLDQIKTNLLTNVDHVIIQQTKNDGSEVISLLPQKNMPAFTYGNLFKIRMNYFFTNEYTGPMPNGHFPDWSNQADESDNLFTIKEAGYVSYSGNAPFTFSYNPNLFKPDTYRSTNLSKYISIGSLNNDDCSDVSISTMSFGKNPVCTEMTNKYSQVKNYCRITTGSITGTTYKVEASTSEVCGNPPSKEARDFVDHLASELAGQ